MVISNRHQFDYITISSHLNKDDLADFFSSLLKEIRVVYKSLLSFQFLSFHSSRSYFTTRKSNQPQMCPTFIPASLVLVFVSICFLFKIFVFTLQAQQNVRLKNISKTSIENPRISVGDAETYHFRRKKRFNTVLLHKVCHFIIFSLIIS